MALFKCKMRHFALMLKWGVQQSSNSGNQDVLVQLALLWNTLFLTGLNNILKNITLFENEQEIDALVLFLCEKFTTVQNVPANRKKKWNILFCFLKQNKLLKGRKLSNLESCTDEGYL